MPSGLELSDPHISRCRQVEAEAPVCWHHPDLADVTPEPQPAPPSIRREQQRAGHRVGHIVVGPGGMVDGIAAAHGGPALEGQELARQPWVIQKLHRTAGEQRKHVAVDVGPRPVRRPVDDAAPPEGRHRPIATVSIADHDPHAIPRQDLGELLDNALKIERRAVQTPLRRPGRLPEEPSPSAPVAEQMPLLAAYAAASIQERVAAGPRAGHPVRRLRSAPAVVDGTELRCARLEGFSLHATSPCLAHAREQLEHLCRYLLRRPWPGRRVLINDDNADGREMMATCLPLAGHNVWKTADGLSGIDGACTHQPNIATVAIGCWERTAPPSRARFGTRGTGSGWSPSSGTVSRTIART